MHPKGRILKREEASDVARAWGFFPKKWVTCQKMGLFLGGKAGNNRAKRVILG